MATPYGVFAPVVYQGKILGYTLATRQTQHDYKTLDEAQHRNKTLDEAQHRSKTLDEAQHDYKTLDEAQQWDTLSVSSNISEPPYT